MEDIQLVELIYAALLGESSWQAFLDRLAMMSPGCWSVLHAHDMGNAAADVGLISGRSADDVADYSDYYYHVSPWVKYCSAAPFGRANVVEKRVPGAMLERTEFYSDFLRPLETRSSIGLGVDREGERSLIVSLMTPGAAEENLLSLASRLNSIGPHLKRAGEFYRRTSFAAQASELGGTFFDALHMGLVVVGNGRRIRTSSQMARRMFGSDVGIDPLGRLRLSDPMTQAVVEAMLLPGYDGPGHRRLSSGEMLLTLIRMSGERERSMFEGPGVCMIIEPLHGTGRLLDIDHFARIHGLTSAEVRALSGLIAGLSLSDIAKQAGRSRETIRSQVKSLCLKTGARGQHDLLRMIAGMKA